VKPGAALRQVPRAVRDLCPCGVSRLR